MGHDHTETETERTRRLNDEMRSAIGTIAVQAYGAVVVTSGVIERGDAFTHRAAEAVSAFDAFDASNDPYGEHDFGAFDLDGEKLFFKLDYYALDMQGHSPDKSDLGLTHRVLTIMLASEY